MLLAIYEDRTVYSLDERFKTRPDENLYSVIESKTKESTDDLYTLINKVKAKKRDRKIFNKRLEGLTLKKIAKENNLSRERVRQIEAAFIKKIQKIISSEIK